MMPSAPPAVEIRIPLEGLPQVRVVANSWEDERRLVGWLERSRLGELLQLAYKLAEPERAA